MGKIRNFMCMKLKWHKCDAESFDGISYVGHCKYCGIECLKDSQGNWFENKWKYKMIGNELRKANERYKTNRGD